MKLMYPEEHLSCSNYIPSDLDFGFKILSLSEGEVLSRNCLQNNVVVFLLRVSLEVQCNEFEKKSFSRKEFFFLPQSSSLTCKVLTDTRLIAFSFTGHISLLCENFNLLTYASSCSDFQYDLKTLKFNRPLEFF